MEMGVPPARGGASNAAPVTEKDVAQLGARVTKFGNEARAFEKRAQQIGTAKDTPSMRKKLQDQRAECQALAKALAKELRAPPADERVRVVMRRTQQQFKELLQAYEHAAKESVKRERTVVVQMSQSLGVGGGFLDREDVGHDAMVRSGQVEMGYGTPNLGAGLSIVEDPEKGTPREKLMDPVLMTVAVDHAILEERNKDLILLEQDLKDLGEIFVDMAVLVDDQQKGLDIIEKNVDKTVLATENAVEELITTRDHQDNGRKLKIILLFLIVGLIVFIIICVAIITPVSINAR